MFVFYIFFYILVDKTSRSESDVSTQSKSRSSSNDGESVTDAESEILVDNEISPKLKLNVQKEVLRLVVNLSSAVASKGSQQEIISYVMNYVNVRECYHCNSMLGVSFQCNQMMILNRL